MLALFSVSSISYGIASSISHVRLAEEQNECNEFSGLNLLQTNASELFASTEIENMPVQHPKDDNVPLDLEFYKRYLVSSDIGNMNLNAKLPNVNELNTQLKRLNAVKEEKYLYMPLPKHDQMKMMPIDLHSRFRHTAAGTAAERLATVKPLAWVHVPKCGSGLINTLIHLPGVCPGVPRFLRVNQQTFSEAFVVNFQKRYPLHKFCPRGFFPGHWGTHEGINRDFDAHYAGHGVIMLRQPEQRIISGWFPHDGLIFNAQQSWPYPHRLARNIKEYARVVSGCATKMLTRDGVPFRPLGHFGGPCGDPRPPSTHEILLGQRRLNAFAFVGLTEEWHMSICLFRAMYGGRCLKSEFANTRPGDRRHGKAPYSVKKLLGNYRDPYDGPLYREGVRLFWQRVRQFKLTREGCARTCFRSAMI